MRKKYYSMVDCIISTPLTTKKKLMTFKKLFIPVVSFALIALFVSVTSVSAQQVYQYVTSSGMMQTVVAENPTQAIATAYNIGAHSGVMLLGGLGGADFTYYPNNNNYFYQFVNTSGTISSMYASSPTNALNTATNISEHSGVIYVNSATSL